MFFVNAVNFWRYHDDIFGIQALESAVSLGQGNNALMIVIDVLMF